jgi:hypothetical protein
MKHENKTTECVYCSFKFSSTTSTGSLMRHLSRCEKASDTVRAQYTPKTSTQPKIYEGGAERPMSAAAVQRAHHALEEIFLNLCVPFRLVGSLLI